MSDRLQRFDDFLSRLPVLSGWSPIARFFFVAVVVLAIVITSIVLNLMPTTEERLCEGIGTWCIEEIRINGEPLTPLTYGVSISYRDEYDCKGNLCFRDDVVTFPGLNSYPGNGRWFVDGDSMTIEYTNPDARVFERKYFCEIKRNVLLLQSDSVTIRAHYVRLNLPF